MLFKMYSRVGDAILHDNFYLPIIIFATSVFIISVIIIMISMRNIVCNIVSY